MTFYTLCPHFLKEDECTDCQLKNKNIKISDGAIIEHPCEIGDNSIIGANAVLRPWTVIGHHTIFGALSISEGKNFIGNYVTIHSHCNIPLNCVIEDNCFIGPYFIANTTPVITKGKHGTAPEEEFEIKPTVIEAGCRIGSNVHLIPGIRIGHDSMVDQDTLITKNVPPYAIVRGGKDKVGRIIGATTH